MFFWLPSPKGTAKFIRFRDTPMHQRKGVKASHIAGQTCGMRRDCGQSSESANVVPLLSARQNAA